MSEHEVDVDFIRELLEAGLEDLTVEQIIDLSDREVDLDVVRTMRKLGTRG